MSQRVRNLKTRVEMNSESRSQTERTQMEKRLGEAAPDGPGLVRRKPFWDPHPVPHFPKGQEPPTPYPGLLASFPINRWPAQPSHPRLTASAQPSPWQGAPRLDPYPFMLCGPSPRVKGRRDDDGIPLAKWPESPLPAMQDKGDRETQ